jgi:PAS domain S-box-containing protein
MSQPTTDDAEAQGDEIALLVRRLLETEERLRDLTQGEVDAILDFGGRSYLLRQAQERLRDSEARLRLSESSMATAQSIAHIGSWERDLRGPPGSEFGLTRWSDEMFRIVGFQPGAVTPTAELYVSLVPDAERDRLRQAVAAAIDERAPLDIIHRLIRPSGDERIVHLVGGMMVNEDTGQPISLGGMTHDVTEQKRSEARLRRLVDSNIQGVFFWKFNGEITDANDAFLNLVGYGRDDLARGLLDWRSMTPPDYQSLIEGAMSEIAENGFHPAIEKEFFRKNGTRVPVLVGAATFDDNPDEGVCYVLDISARKLAEAQALQMQRLATLGQMAVGLAHELNQPLAVMSMAAENAIELIEGGGMAAVATRKLRRVIEQASRASEIIQNVKMFGRRDGGPAVPTRIADAVASTVAIMHNQLEASRARVDLSLPADLPPVFLAPVQLEQVLTNLLGNAVDAYAATQAGERVITIAAKAEADEVALCVADRAGGIPDAVLPRIFDPFFTTKPVGQGTGLGLSISYSIVSAAGGTVTARNTDGGALFEIRLPTGRRRAAPLSSSAPAPPATHP